MRSGYCRVKYVTNHTRPDYLLFSSGKGRAFQGFKLLKQREFNAVVFWKDHTIRITEEGRAKLLSL